MAPALRAAESAAILFCELCAAQAKTADGKQGNDSDGKKKQVQQHGSLTFWQTQG